MKLFTTLLLILAIIGTQAKFNLRTYAQHKLQRHDTLKAQVDSGTHEVHSDIQNRVKDLLDTCFEKVLGVENSGLTTTKQVEDFQKDSALDGLNLCLQSNNLRLSHSEEGSFGTQIDDIKLKANALIAAQAAFNADKAAIAGNITNELQSITSKLSQIKNSVTDSAKIDANGDPMDGQVEASITNKESEFETQKTKLQSSFEAFHDNTLDEKDLTERHVADIAAAKAAFDATKVDMEELKVNLTNIIVGHYKEAFTLDCSNYNRAHKISGEDDNGDDIGNCKFFPHAVSGYEGQGCGISEEPTENTYGDVEMPASAKETALKRMCGDGLKCVARDDTNLVFDPNRVNNLDTSGYYICVDASKNTNTALKDQEETTSTACPGKTSSTQDMSTDAVCNLYLLMSS